MKQFFWLFMELDHQHCMTNCTELCPRRQHSKRGQAAVASIDITGIVLLKKLRRGKLSGWDNTQG